MKLKNITKIIFLSLFFTVIFNVNPNLSADDFRGWSSFGRLAYEVENNSDKDIIVWDADTDWENGRKWTVRLGGIDDMDECNVQSFLFQTSFFKQSVQTEVRCKSLSFKSKALLFLRQNFFREVFEALGRVRTHSDPFRSIGMHSDAFGSNWKRFDTFANF